MKPIEKNTLLTALVVVLVALNIGLVTFMWYTQRPRQEGPDTTRFLINQMHFDKTQEQQYVALQHRLSDSLEPIKDAERKIHDRFFEMMHAENPDTALVAATIESMGHLRSRIEYFTFVHFRQVRALCTPEQQKKFDAVISDLMRHMGPRPPHRNGGPQDGHDGPSPGEGPPPR